MALQGHVALVTGASSGLGRAVALELARAGADTALFAGSESELQRVAAEPERGGPGVVAPGRSREC